MTTTNKAFSKVLLLTLACVLVFALAYIDASARQERNTDEHVTIRCQSFPEITQLPSGAYEVTCTGHVRMAIGTEVRWEIGVDDPYPMPTEDSTYPAPVVTDIPGCIRAWDGEPCYPDE